MESPDSLPLEPLRYLAEIVQYLQTQEADLWKWFSADPIREKHNEAVRLDLLKATYRIEREVNPSLYAYLDEVATALKLTMPMTCYQSPGNGGLNASLAYMPGEAHIVLTGPVLATLTPVEVRCVLGHELMHFALLDRWPEYLVASQVLAAMTNDAQTQPAHMASARLFTLYTEVYCDRGSVLATNDSMATITALVKIETGTTDVSAESFLRQADEIFEKGELRSKGVTHPETFIRARAIKHWVDEPTNAAGNIAQVIEGPLAIEELDLLGQQKVSALTRRLITLLLQHEWLRTDPQIAHARLFFDDFEASNVTDKSLAADLAAGTDKLRDYFCYVMLDFAAADRDLEEAPLAAALLLSDELAVGDRFRQLAMKELNLRKKQLEALDADASKIVAKAREAAA